ncbi:MAG: hypothetical protein ACRD5H_13000, partial [Nitrososphaerales archaeon]
GITVLAIVPAIYTLLLSFPNVSRISWLIVTLLICLLGYDMWAISHDGVLEKEEKEEEKEGGAAASAS